MMSAANETIRNATTVELEATLDVSCRNHLLPATAHSEGVGNTNGGIGNAVVEGVSAVLNCSAATGQRWSEWGATGIET
jgi:hypothetical protein